MATPGRSVIMSPQVTQVTTPQFCQLQKGHQSAQQTTPAGPSDRRIYRKKEYQVDRESAEYKEVHIYLSSILEEHPVSDRQTTAKIITFVCVNTNHGIELNLNSKLLYRAYKVEESIIWII